REVTLMLHTHNPIMLHTHNPIIKHNAGLLKLAEEPGNVSTACKSTGVSRDTFYRYQELAAEGGIDALVNQNRRGPNLTNRADEATERAVVGLLSTPLSSRPPGSTGPVMSCVKKACLPPAAACAPYGNDTTWRTSVNA
ncbi:integrase catalytic subunit, partial [Erwinia tracheiphila PSU-1]